MAPTRAFYRAHAARAHQKCGQQPLPKSGIAMTSEVLQVYHKKWILDVSTLRCLWAGVQRAAAVCSICCGRAEVETRAPKCSFWGFGRAKPSG